MATFPGLKFIQTSSDEADSHILGYQTARATATSLLLDVWNGASSAAREWGVILGGRTRGGDGSVALPAFSFLSDTDSGVYRIGADNLGVAVGGAKVLDVAAKGLTIDQGANDDEILALKSSDVAHGVTTRTEMDSFAYLKKFAGVGGGLLLEALSDAQGTGPVLGLSGISGVNADSTKSAAGRALIEMDASLASGTGTAAVNADGNVGSFRNNGSTVWLVDEDGDTWQAGGIQAAGAEVLTSARVLQNVSMDAVLLTENLGAAGAVLRVNSGGSAPEWSAAAGSVREVGLWFADNIAGTTSQGMFLDTGGAVRTKWITVRAGSVTGIWVHSNAARTGGTLTVEANINAVATGLTAVIDATNTEKDTTTQAEGLDTFAVGDELTIIVTTSGFTPAGSADITAGLEITV